MDWITETLAIGGLEDLMDFSRLVDERVEAVLQLHDAHEEALVPLPVELLQLEVEDRRTLDRRVLTQGVRFIRRQQLAGRRTLVCCGAGLSRSPSFVAAFFYEDGMDLEKAFALIRQRRAIRPHRRLLQSLHEHYGIEQD
jgi:protein-tyrosine phosphatase